MTVAAVILAPSAEAALADVEGEAAVRRPVRAAWAGGALPTIHVVPQPERVAAATVDLQVTVVGPPPDERGIAWFVHGLRTARASVTETDAALLWPFAYGWVDPETITSLIEAHGAAPGAIVRPAYHGEPGFPILVPAAEEARLVGMFGIHGEEAIHRLVSEGAAYREVEVGDPGAVHDVSTPREALPSYHGPPGPAGDQPPEWNAAIGAQAERHSDESGGSSQ